MRWAVVLAFLLAMVTCLQASQPRSRALTLRSFKLASVLRQNQRKLLRRAGLTGNALPAALHNTTQRKRYAQRDYLNKVKKSTQVKPKPSKREKPKRNRKKKNRKTKKRKRLSSRKDLCLFKSLRRCGRKVIKNLTSPPGFNKRCSTKERFLDCMSRMQRRSCKVKGRSRHGPSRKLVKKYQRRLQRLLSTTRGCVIGVDFMQTEAH